MVAAADPEGAGHGKTPVCSDVAHIVDWDTVRECLSKLAAWAGIACPIMASPSSFQLWRDK